MRVSFATLRLPLPDFPSTVAVIVTGPPTVTPAMSPPGLTETTAGLLLLQLNVLTSRFPEASRASALARTVSPTRRAAGRVTVTVATALPPLPPGMLNPPQPRAAARAATARKRSAEIIWAGCGGRKEIGLDVLARRRRGQRRSPRGPPAAPPRG